MWKKMLFFVLLAVGIAGCGALGPVATSSPDTINHLAEVQVDEGFTNAGDNYVFVSPAGVTTVIAGFEHQSIWYWTIWTPDMEGYDYLQDGACYTFPSDAGTLDLCLRNKEILYKVK